MSAPAPDLSRLRIDRDAPAVTVNGYVVARTRASVSSRVPVVEAIR